MCRIDITNSVMATGRSCSRGDVVEPIDLGASSGSVEASYGLGSVVMTLVVGASNQWWPIRNASGIQERGTHAVVINSIRGDICAPR